MWFTEETPQHFEGKQTNVVFSTQTKYLYKYSEFLNTYNAMQHEKNLEVTLQKEPDCSDLTQKFKSVWCL
jgi:hypothetical protein